MKKFIKYILIGLVAFILAGALAKACTGSNEAQMPKDVDGKINYVLEKKSRSGVGKLSDVEIVQFKDSADKKNVFVTLKGSSWKKSSLLFSTANMLEELAKIKEVQIVCFVHKGKGVDVYGKESEVDLMKIVFDRKEIDKMVFENLDSNNLPKMADQYNEHPKLEK